VLPTSSTGDNRIRRSATAGSAALPGTRRYQEPGAACWLSPRRVPPTSRATAERWLSVAEGRNVTSNTSGGPCAVSSHAAPRALSTGAGGGTGLAGGLVLSAPWRASESPGATAAVSVAALSVPALSVRALSGGTATAESGPAMGAAGVL